MREEAYGGGGQLYILLQDNDPRLTLPWPLFQGGQETDGIGRGETGLRLDDLHGTLTEG